MARPNRDLSVPTAPSASGARGATEPDPISPVLEGILTRFAETVRRAARRHNLAESDIDEVFQDVRIRLWRALSGGEKLARVPASYVYRAAMSAAVDLIRRRRANRAETIYPLQEQLRAPGSAADEEVELAELEGRLSRAIVRLVESRRVVVRMHLVGYHRHEIAELLGWSEAKTRNLLYRGLADLRELLAEPNGHARGRGG